MDITCYCGNCLQPLTTDAAAAGTLVNCGNCGKPMEVPKQSKPIIGRPAPVTAARPKLANITSNSPAGTATVTAPLLPKANAPAVLRLEKQQKKKYLDRLRQQSAYPELRTTVVILKILGYAAAAVLFLMSLALGSQVGQFVPGGRVILFFGGLFQAAIVIAITMVGCSSASMLIDLADSVIDRNARETD